MGDDRMVEITMDGENTATVSRKAFELVWKDKGWKIVDAVPQEAPVRRTARPAEEG